MSMKNPMTPAGIELATFQFVAQHLNHCATMVPSICRVTELILIEAEVMWQGKHVSVMYGGLRRFGQSQHW